VGQAHDGCANTLVVGGQGHAHMSRTRRTIEAARRHQDAQVGHLGNQGPVGTNARRRAHRVLNPDLHRVGVAGRRDAEGRTDAAQDFIG